jgi:hypothetical protein
VAHFLGKKMARSFGKTPGKFFAPKNWPENVSFSAPVPGGLSIYETMKAGDYMPSASL